MLDDESLFDKMVARRRGGRGGERQERLLGSDEERMAVLSELFGVVA